MKLDLLTLDFDIAKARKGAMIGEERVWHGVTYVKTISGWRPKAKEKNPKTEEPSTPRMKKVEDPAKVREKQLEEFASKAKDSQLEAAIKDPKQNQEVKDIAQAELDKRTGGAVEEEKKGKKKKEKFTPDPTSLAILEKFDSLKKELKETFAKKQEEKGKQEKEFKVIKKTGVTVDGKKIFITMNENNTGYIAKGSGVNITSEEGEDLASFKETVKKEAEKVFGKKKEETQKVKEQLESDLGRKLGEDFKPIKRTSVTVDGKKTAITMDNGDYVAKVEGKEIRSKEEEPLKEFKERIKEEVKQEEKKVPEEPENWEAEVVNAYIDAMLEGDKEEYREYDEDEEYESPVKHFFELKDQYSKEFDRYKTAIEEGSKLTSSIDKKKLNSWIGEVFASSESTARLAMNSVLLEKGELPYCTSELYEYWEGEGYRVFSPEEGREAMNAYEEACENTPKKSEEIEELLSWYRGDGFQYFTAAALGQYEKAKNGIKNLLDEEDVEDYYEKTTLEMMRDLIEGDFEAKIKEYQKKIDGWLNSYEMSENIVLSRRMFGDEAAKIVGSFKVGDTFTMKPMQSFASLTQGGFGSIQLTLLVKKGTKGITPIDNTYELEYLTKSNTKTKVVSVGYNSAVLEIIEEDKSLLGKIKNKLKPLS